MKQLLIIRSVSFQQLDLNLTAIRNKFPDYQINILTHEHGVKLAQKYDSIQNIYVYPYKQGFSFGKKVSEINDKKFDAVIIPVTNVTGVGFNNVFLFSMSLKSDRKYMCNVVSELKEISNFKILLNSFAMFVFKIISAVLTAVFTILAFVFFVFKIIFSFVGKLFTCR